MSNSQLRVRGTIFGLVLVPFIAFLFMVIWNANTPYCGNAGGGEDRLACTLMLVWVPVFTILPGGLFGFLIAVCIGLRRGNSA
jgi:hypothetical protein